MSCELTVYDPAAKASKVYVCDEDNAGRMVENDHAGGSGEYADVKGSKFSVDWTQLKLVAFSRK